MEGGLAAINPQTLLEQAKDEYEDARASMRWISQRLNENMAFFAGKQYGIATYAGMFVPQTSTEVAEEVYNYVWSTVRSWMASIIRSKPTVRSVPASDSSDDIARGRCTDRLVKSIAKSNLIDLEELIRGETKVAVHGAGFYKVYWDPSKGKATKVPKMTEGPEGPVQETDFFGRPSFETVFEGAPAFEFHDVIDVLPDPMAVKRGEVRHVFHRKMLPYGVVNDRFKVDAFGQPTEGRWENVGHEYEQVERDAIENDSRAFATSGGSPTSSRAKTNQMVRLNEGWYKPTAQFPNGLLIVWSGDMIIALTELPYEWPWVMRLGPGLRGGLIADGIVQHIKPMQRTLNVTASKRREWIDYILSPPLLVPEGSDIRKDHISDVAGYILNFNASAGKPEWMNVPNIPQSMFETEGSLVQQIKDISGVSDIDRGGVPQGLSTARAMAYQYEFQQGVSEPDTGLFKLDYLRVITLVLKLFRDYMPDNRLISMLGENNAWERTAFRRDDYDFDVELILEEENQPNSKALREANAKEYFQIGALNDTPEAERFRKMNGLDYIDEESSRIDGNHRRRALKEILQFKDWVAQAEAGMVDESSNPLYVMEQDKHDTHIDVIDNFRITDEYIALPDWAKQMVDQHSHLHQQAMLEQMQMFGMQQGAMGANGAGPPPAKNQMASPFDGGKSDIAAMGEATDQAALSGDTAEASSVAA